MEDESDGDTNCNKCTWYSHQRTDTETEDFEVRGGVETIQTTALLKLARIKRRIL